MSKEPTNSEMLQEILQAIHQFSSHTDQRFNAVDQRFDAMDQRFDAMDQRVNKVEIACIDLKEGVTNLDKRVTNLEEQHERTFRRLDDFLTIYARHDTEIAFNATEIASLRATDERLSKRLTIVEEKLAV